VLHLVRAQLNAAGRALPSFTRRAIGASFRKAMKQREAG
jgi:hypothetical protein